MTVSESAKLLGSKDGILLLTHKNPDGDTVMSAAALCRALRRKNKKAYLYRNPQITKKMLPFVDKLFAPESFVPKYIVSVDIATENLFPQGPEPVLPGRGHIIEGLLHILDNLGSHDRLIRFIGLLRGQRLHPRTVVMVNNGGCTRVVILHITDVNLGKTVSRSGIARNVDVHK